MSHGHCAHVGHHDIVNHLLFFIKENKDVFFIINVAFQAMNQICFTFNFF
jgi:hypothetical protein